MLNIDELIKHVKRRTGHQNEYVVKKYIMDLLSDSVALKDQIADMVMIDMTLDGEWDEETPQEKRERLERVNNGGN